MAELHQPIKSASFRVGDPGTFAAKKGRASRRGLKCATYHLRGVRWVSAGAPIVLGGPRGVLRMFAGTKPYAAPATRKEVVWLPQFAEKFVKHGQHSPRPL